MRITYVVVVVVVVVLPKVASSSANVPLCALRCVLRSMRLTSCYARCGSGSQQRQSVAIGMVAWARGEYTYNVCGWLLSRVSGEAHERHYLLTSNSKGRGIWLLPKDNITGNQSPCRCRELVKYLGNDHVIRYTVGEISISLALD
jgi:hypothetical protein